MKKQFRNIIDKILSGEIKSRDELDSEKRKISRELGLKKFIRNSEILKYAKPSERKKVLKILQKKPTRTISGVAVVAAMTMPTECPHGRCTYCPGGVEIQVPQSYTGKEPATRRAIHYDFNPYLQVTFRLQQLQDIGHPIDKVELIIMGGTLTAQFIDYQEWFVKECLKAMNEFDKNHMLIKRIGEKEFIHRYNNSKKDFHYLEDIQKQNEGSRVRCIGLTFESRPDWVKESEVDWMLNFGVTKVELGVQTLSDTIYKRVKRGHTVRDVIESTRVCKDSFLKVAYHMMPNLFSDVTRDKRDFKKLFENSSFKPDMLKIYPCLVLEGTELHDMWKKGEYKPYPMEDVVELIAEVKENIPKYVRILRVQRDIPSPLVVSGVKKSNLRQIIEKRMEEKGVKCSCIRCREVGHKMLKESISIDFDAIELERMDYEASNGKEIFLNFEDKTNDALIGFLRLRKPSEKAHRPEITDNTLGIRELHVYGEMLSIGGEPEIIRGTLYSPQLQHRGFGGKLLKEAERISLDEFDAEKLIVISGIGAKEYYYKFGFERDGPYLSKKLL